MSPPTLDSLLETARAASVPAELAQRHVAELERWARPEPRAPWWRAGLLVATGALAAAAALWLWWRAAPPPIVPLGDRVALIAEPGAHYRVLTTDRSHTEVLVERGTVTARLWKGQGAHALSLRGGGVIAAATGTVYSLTVEHGQPSVRVHEGTVEVRPESSTSASARVAAGTSWPGAEPSHGEGAARRLLRFRGLAAAPHDLDGGVESGPALGAAAGVATDATTDAMTNAADATTDATTDAMTDAAPGMADATTGTTDATTDAAPDARTPRPTRNRSSDPVATPDAAPTAPDAAPATPADRWRLARLRRGQGKFREALAECLTIVNTADATWAPIALVEAARLTLGPLAEPQQTLDLARRMRTAWPKHTLLTEMRAIECRALKQLGRGAECAVLERTPAP